MAEQLHLGAGAGRQQVALKKGHSLMDWIRLKGKRQRAMAGVDGQGKKFVTVEELEAHAGPDGEIWMALHGFVFNITDYLDFHPGGHAQLMRGAGRDATALFDDYHRWVNYQSMLDMCVVGRLVKSKDSFPAPRKTTLSTPSSLHVPDTSFARPAPPPVSLSKSPSPSVSTLISSVESAAPQVRVTPAVPTIVLDGVKGTEQQQVQTVQQVHQVNGKDVPAPPTPITSSSDQIKAAAGFQLARILSVKHISSDTLDLLVQWPFAMDKAPVCGQHVWLRHTHHASSFQDRAYTPIPHTLQVTHCAMFKLTPSYNDSQTCKQVGNTWWWVHLSPFCACAWVRRVSVKDEVKWE
eukprot:m.102575 g.102575  ORF g.102575 m.102575 type:complete len:351 (-) comp13225_c0_seq10:1201-2253(-)